jgi:hypothetical protein
VVRRERALVDHMIDKGALEFEALLHVGIEKVEQSFRDIL